MVICIATLAVAYLAGFALMAIAVKGSPVGYEDENGFIQGNPPCDDDGQR
jgi:hypothetical protein